MVPTRTSAPLFESGERAIAEAVVAFAFGNPFGPAPAAAKPVFTGPAWSQRGKQAPPQEHRLRLRAELTPLVAVLRDRLAGGLTAAAQDLGLYQDLCLFYLYDRYADRLRTLIGKPAGRVDFYSDFAAEHASLRLRDPGHLFACAFQIRRALHFIASTLLGSSPAAARLRAQVWESIFTHNLRRYLRTMYARMNEIPTLVLGESGTGKERAARAIGLSGYIPFEEQKLCFAAAYAEGFHGLNLSALTPTVLESELFGHLRGSFTGALADKSGWLSVVGTLFLDEIGEIGWDLQIKLLRILQERAYQAVGSRENLPVRCKIILATNRDLDKAMKEDAFRVDLYMRICVDRIRTPSLRTILAEAPGERRTLVRHIAEAMTSPEEADEVTDEVEAWIHANLPPDYPWTGNIRELEGFVKNRLVHHSCPPIALALPAADAEPGKEAAERAAPIEAGAEVDPEEAAFIRDLREGNLTPDKVVGRLATIVQAKTGSIRETARVLGMDRRNVTRLIDHELLARLVKQRGRSE